MIGLVKYNKFQQKVNQSNYYNQMSFSRKQDNQEGAYLIEKYGLDSVQTLIDYLQNNYFGGEQLNLKQAQKYRDQIRYLKAQKKKHLQKQKHQIIDHITDCIQDEKINILQQFEQESRQNFDQFIDEASSIQNELHQHHISEIKLLEANLNKDYSRYVTKKSQSIIQLNHQLRQLCAREQYEQAELTQRKLEKEQKKNLNKKKEQFNEHKKKQIMALKMKQQKQMNSLRYRLNLMADQQIKYKNNQFEKLIKKIDMCKTKIVDKIGKDGKFRDQIQSLASSRCFLKTSRNCSSINNSRNRNSRKSFHNQPETGPSSQAHTDRFSPILQDQLRR